MEQAKGRQRLRQDSSTNHPFTYALPAHSRTRWTVMLSRSDSCMWFSCTAAWTAATYHGMDGWIDGWIQVNHGTRGLLREVEALKGVAPSHPTLACSWSVSPVLAASSAVMTSSCSRSTQADCASKRAAVCVIVAGDGRGD